jgi:5-(carboxyamino)imidazole ribonucleotide synthase
LGRMLLQAAANYPVETYVMEDNSTSPAAHLAHHFVKGHFNNADEVYEFGKDLDAVTIEIESVSKEGLERLEAKGVKVFPSSKALGIIQDKITQKQFYKEHDIPTAAFAITQRREDILEYEFLLPAVHKIGKGGYDGKGVVVIPSINNLRDAFEPASVLEKKVDIDKEISVIVAVGQDREMVTYPIVEMVADPELNLLDYQVSPAALTKEQEDVAKSLARDVAKHLDSPGIFAVELFVTKTREILVNETAPRVHNSGHHTIEANYSSQFDMLWRIILGYPLGDTSHIIPAAMVNMLGEGGEGAPVYNGLTEALAIPGVFVHIYGKQFTRAGKKMGHITVVSEDYSTLVDTAHHIKHLIKVEPK